MNDLFPITDPNRSHGCRIQENILWQGMKALIVQNEIIQIVILADKGTEIVQFLHKPTDTDFIWHGRNELHDPATFIPVGGTDATPFFDRWSGGWFEIVPNNGPGCDYRNAHLGFYGEVVNIPWHYQILEDRHEQVSIAFWVKTYRMPFLLRKKMTLRSNSGCLQIEEQLTNLGNEKLDFAWGHHPVIGSPFLDSSCRISAPKCRIIVGSDEDGPGYRMKLFQEAEWPIIEDVDGKPLDLRVMPCKEIRSMDNCYLTSFDKEAFISVTNTNRNVGFGFAWDPAVFKYMWLWQALGGGVGYPWFMDSYQMGIEPWTSYPCSGLQEAIENRTAAQIEPGQSIYSWLTAVSFTGNRDVSHIRRDGEVLFT